MKGAVTRALRLSTAAGLSAGWVLAGAWHGTAWAEAPVQTGWWTQANPGSVEGSPTTPSPPDVPAGGLLVEGGMSSASGSTDAGPSAFGAVVYQIPSGQGATSLTLGVVPGSATTPAATLEVCPLSSPGINAEQGGSMTDAPSYSCATNVTAPSSSAGNAYTFDVAKLVSDGALAVAILPTSPTDRVVLAKPGDPSLPLRPTSGSGSAGGGTAVGAAGGAVGGASGGAGSGAAASSSGSAGPASGAAPSASGDPSASVTPSVSDPSSLPAEAAPAAPTASAAGSGATRQAAASSSQSSGTGTTSGLSFAPQDSSGPADPKPLAVALVIVGFLIGTGIWLAAGRAAARAAVGGGAGGTA